MKLRYVGYSSIFKVENKAIAPNVLEVCGSKLPCHEVGFVLIDDEGIEYDYTEYKTLYRTVEGGFQYSNDGSIWVEPTKNVAVFIEWKDKENVGETRPSKVQVEVSDDSTVVDSLILNAENNWTKTYDVPESETYTVSAPDIEEYTKEIVGTKIIYTLPEPPAPYVPSTEEMIEELTNMVLELDERVYALEEGE